MMNNTNNDDKKRREVWFALFGAHFLGSFLIFDGCQAQIFPGLNAVAKGSLFPVAATALPATATPQSTTTAGVTPTATAVPITPMVPVRVLEAPLVVPLVNRQGVTEHTVLLRADTRDGKWDWAGARETVFRRVLPVYRYEWKSYNARASKGQWTPVHR